MSLNQWYLPFSLPLPSLPSPSLTIPALFPPSHLFKISVTSTDKCHGATITPEDLNNNLVWVTSSFSGLTFYGKFLPNAIADGRLVTTTNEFNASAGEVSTTIPHFFDYTGMAPFHPHLISSGKHIAFTQGET